MNRLRASCSSAHWNARCTVPRRPGDHTNDSDRGICLMRRTADCLRWRPPGNLPIAAFRRFPVPYEARRREEAKRRYPLWYWQD
ncbi:MAG: hypothetical protein ACLFTT_10545 [Candidatus Hydrogenedentota bacterium]